MLGGARGPALIPVLGGTGRLQLAYGALATAGLALGAADVRARRPRRSIAGRFRATVC